MRSSSRLAPRPSVGPPVGAQDLPNLDSMLDNRNASLEEAVDVAQDEAEEDESEEAKTSAAPHPEAVALEEEVECCVVHPRVAMRANPSTSAEALGFVVQGCVVKGLVEDVCGIKWLRVRALDFEALAGGKVAENKHRPAWILMHGDSLGLGQLLKPVGELHAPELEQTTSFTMRRVPERGLALFATQGMNVGEVVVQERPFFTRPQTKQVKQYAVLSTPQWAEAFKQIQEPLRVPGEDADAKIFASTAMVRNALGYAKALFQVRQSLMQLHCPDLESSHPLITVAYRLAELCLDQIEECQGLDQQELQRAILVIEMNIFTGGRCFAILSRLNHSCFPNAVVIGTNDHWCFKALRPIRADEEFLVSYLGMELLLPTEIRQRHLWRSKCFECECERCMSDADPMRAIPCRWCAKSRRWFVVIHSAGTWLREAPSTEGWKLALLPQGEELIVVGECEGDWVPVTIPGKHTGWVLSHGRSLEPPLGTICTATLGAEEGDAAAASKSMVRSYWSTFVQYLLPPDYMEDKALNTVFDDIALELWLPTKTCNMEFDGPCASFRNGSWQCETCGRVPEHHERLRATERLLGRLAERTFLSPKTTKSVDRLDGKSGGGFKMVKQGFVLEALELAVAASGVLGMKHWTVQWAGLLFLDLVLSKMSCRPHLAVPVLPLLKLVRSLWGWLESLGMAHGPGCFLHARASEVLRLLGDRRAHMDEPQACCFDELKELLNTSKAQVEILPLRPLIIDGTVSF